MLSTFRHDERNQEASKNHLMPTDGPIFRSNCGSLLTSQNGKHSINLSSLSTFILGVALGLLIALFVLIGAVFLIAKWSKQP